MMELEELLEQCQRANIVLIPSARRRVSPWCPGRRISRPVRAAIRGQAETLLKLIEMADSRVCPSPELHCCYGPVCYVCQRLDAAMREQQPRTYIQHVRSA